MSLDLISDQVRQWDREQDTLAIQIRDAIWERVDHYTRMLFQVFPELESFSFSCDNDDDYARVDRATEFTINGEDEAYWGAYDYLGHALVKIFTPIHEAFDDPWIRHHYGQDPEFERPGNLGPSIWNDEDNDPDQDRYPRSALGEALHGLYREETIDESFPIWEIIELAAARGQHEALEQIAPLRLEAVL